LKKLLVIIFVSWFIGAANYNLVFAEDKPEVLSFQMTPDTVDLSDPNPTVSFELIVRNSTGIASLTTQVTLTDGANNSLPITLTRTDSPIIENLATVTFKGSINIPSSLPSGVYSATAKPITARNSNGQSGYSTDLINATSKSNIVGGLNSLLVRNSGKLNYSYKTFVGPSYGKNKPNNFTNPKYIYAADPIWKVGESFDPNDYYELKVPTLKLKTKVNTSSTCTTDGNTIKFIKEGNCEFQVYTDATMDYQALVDVQTVNITSARVKPTYFVGTIPTQSSTILPLTINGPLVYGPLGVVIPVSATPSVCYPSGSYITIISGGTCTLNYSSPANSNNLASDIFPLTFEISRSPQTITFDLPTKLTISNAYPTLNASASSGLPIVFSSGTTAICDVEANRLKLFKAGNCQIIATQIGSTTVSPATVSREIEILGNAQSSSRNSPIKCKKNGKIKAFLSKSCPIGYRLVK
jgi:hypothetical protein